MKFIDRIDDNLSLSSTPQTVDRMNREFYGRFPFPWRPKSVDSTSDPDFSQIMLNQNLGDWTHQMIPAEPHIWVAGCGTNQAAITAVHFPRAAVRGSDVSETSLGICQATAQDLGCKNLELCNESINQSDYEQRFDYIICTGVIHHNADPEATLGKLARALKPAGVLELMVYNRYHRILTSAFQKGVRLLAQTESQPDFQKELSVTRALANDFPGQGLMRQFVNNFKQAPDPQIADALIQPVENSYTVDTLEEMARRCDLELLAPSPNAMSNVLDGVSQATWNLRFSQADLQKEYDKLPDSCRWQITNLLLCESSPMLWFYLRRKDSPRKRSTEQQICDSFLRTRFKANAVSRHAYVLSQDNKYMHVKSALPYPGLPSKPHLRQIVEAMAMGLPMGRTLESLRISRDFTTVNDLRLRLTPSVNPFLRSIA
jgi:SAM-dependent methyltransferase